MSLPGIELSAEPQNTLGGSSEVDDLSLPECDFLLGRSKDISSEELPESSSSELLFPLISSVIWSVS